MNQEYVKQSVSKLYASGIAQTILDSRNKKSLEIDLKKVFNNLTNSKHRNQAENIATRGNLNGYFRFVADYIKVVQDAAYSPRDSSRGKVDSTKRGVRLDSKAIEHFCEGWEKPEIKKYIV